MKLSGRVDSLSLAKPGLILSNFRQNAFEMLQMRVTENDHFYDNYNQTLKRKKGKYQQRTKFTLGPEKVAEKVNHAISSDNPRTRYFVTFQALKN